MCMVCLVHLFSSVLCFPFIDRIFPKEHFKEKYAVDEVHHTCDVSLSVLVFIAQPLWCDLFFCMVADL